MRFQIIGSILVLLGVAIAGAAIRYVKIAAMNAPQRAQEEHPTQVVMAEVEPIQLRSSATAIGTVVAPRSIQLKTELVGTVSSIQFQSGDLVKPGQVLVQFDTSVEEAQLAYANAIELMAASTFKRTKQAFDAKALTELELEQSVAQLAQAKAEVARVGAIIRKKTLSAPFVARAGVFDIQPGQYLSEGSLITMLQGIDEFVYVDFMMPQHVADDLHVGNEVSLLTETSPITASIVAVDSQADKVSRSLMARAKVIHPPGSMQINDSVKVEMQYGNVVPMQSIPVSALRTSPSGAFVFVVEPDASKPGREIVHSVNVIPGRSAANQVAILSGLKTGQKIVSDGSFKIQEGTWVVDISAATGK